MLGSVIGSVLGSAIGSGAGAGCVSCATAITGTTPTIAVATSKAGQLLFFIYHYSDCDRWLRLPALRIACRPIGIAPIETGKLNPALQVTVNNSERVRLIP